MRYEPGGRHLCHYDAGYDYGDEFAFGLDLVLDALATQLTES